MLAQAPHCVTQFSYKEKSFKKDDQVSIMKNLLNLKMLHGDKAHGYVTFDDTKHTIMQLHHGIEEIKDEIVVTTDESTETTTPDCMRDDCISLASASMSAQRRLRDEAS